MLENISNKKAFTFVELIIALILSSIIFLFLMNFISVTFGEISYSKNKTNIISQIYEFEDKIKDLREKYNSGIILKNNTEGTGSDILLFRTSSGEINKKGIIIAMVSNNTLTIDTDNNIDNIEDKVLAYKNISSEELDLLSTDIDDIYTFIFN
ncbi:MAG: prepilin-type N-terminal cleavage/methylation domain-containing protein, partial [Candidatus Gracilibacteria bacterium]|nr:prepilin-type N-terminal cleavage/methylation domain-containing protein [Candidatus Gracilibacteria bacterium]